MNEQDGTQSSTKQRRSRKVNTADQEYVKQAPAAQRPANDDTEAWKKYWRAQGQSWRIEPEIDIERQKYLAERLNITPDWKQGIFPFKDIRLSRADIEWLLATHENGRGPVDWSAKSQRVRWGLDLRGANLSQINLHTLPLAHLRGGLTSREWLVATDAQRDMAAVNVIGCDLFRANLEGARLRRAHLEQTSFQQAHLEDAYLEEAFLERTNLFRTHFEGADLRGAHLEDAVLCEAFFDVGTNLRNLILGKKGLGSALLADVHWGGVNLATLNWSQVNILGDEYVAQQKKYNDTIKDKENRLKEFEQADRANRQLAVELQAQGLNEDAARFAYRAQKLQRVVFRRQRKFAKYLFSGILDLLAGYGYKPIRSVIWYLVIIFGFAMAYYVFGHLPFFPDVFVFSLTSFHGRGFFPGLGNETSLHNPLVVLAALEAVIGLLIEISFIATFTQRFFGK